MKWCDDHQLKEPCSECKKLYAVIEATGEGFESAAQKLILENLERQVAYITSQSQACRRDIERSLETGNVEMARHNVKRYLIWAQNQVETEELYRRELQRKT